MPLLEASACGTLSPMPPTPEFESVVPVLETLCGARPDEVIPKREGGYSPSGRWVVRWPDGRSAFVKAEWSQAGHGGIPNEYRVYSHVTASPVPRLIGYEPVTEGAPGVLVTEDLSGAQWGVPVTARDAEMFGEAVDELERVRPPDGLRAVTRETRWDGFAASPDSLVATGLLDAAWLERHADALIDAEAAVDPSGNSLLHLDLWLQNWCRAGRGVVMVDWANSGRGSADVARAWGEAAVRAAGGPCGIIVPHGNAPWAAWMAGLAAMFLAEDGLDHADPRLLETIRREAIATVGWACDELQIQPPSHAPGFDPGRRWRP